MKITAVTSPTRDRFLADQADAIRRLGKQTVDSIIEIGHRLTQCHKALDHGRWLPWLEREFGWGEDTARRYMRVYELNRTSKLRDLKVPVSALYVLSARSTPPQAREEVIKRAQAGEAISHATVKEIVAEHKPVKEPGDVTPEIVTANKPDTQLIQPPDDIQPRPDAERAHVDVQVLESEPEDDPLSLAAENVRLEAENAALKEENAALRAENARLRAMTDERLAEHARLDFAKQLIDQAGRGAEL